MADGAPPALARRRLEERAATWSVEPLGAAPRAEELAQHLGNAGVSAGDVTQAAFPHLFEAFVVDPEKPVAAWRLLYSTLLTLLAMAERRSADDLELARILVSTLLDVGFDPAEYRDVLGDLRALMDTEGSLTTLDWALDVAEVLAVNRAPEPEARLGLIMRVFDMAQ